MRPVILGLSHVQSTSPTTLDPAKQDRMHVVIEELAATYKLLDENTVQKAQQFVTTVAKNPTSKPHHILLNESAGIHRHVITTGQYIFLTLEGTTKGFRRQHMGDNKPCFT